MRKTDRPSDSFVLAQFALGICLTAVLAGCAPSLESKRLLARKRLLQTARASMLPVKIYFKRDIVNELDSADETSLQERFARQMVERKMSLDLGGIVLDAQGHVLIADPETEPALIDRIEVIGPDARIYTARISTVLKKMDAAILTVENPAGLVPVCFTSSRKIDKLLDNPPRPAETKSLPALQMVTMFRAGKDWRVGSVGMAGSFLHESNDLLPADFSGPASRSDPFGLGASDTVGSTPALVADRDGNIIGAAMRGRVDLHQKYRIWRGRDILDAVYGDLEYQRFLDSQKTLQEEYSRLYHQVKIYYRQPGENGYASMPEPERIVYGIAVDQTHLLVPLEMTRREARQIESIEVILDDHQQPTDDSFSDSANQPPGLSAGGNRTCSAELVGVFSDFAAFLVKINDADLRSQLDLDALGQIAEVTPFYTIRARQMYGQKDLKVWYARCLWEGKGYGDEFYLRPSSQIAVGSLLVDLHERPAGLYLRQRLPAEEQHVMEGSVSEALYGYSRSGSPGSTGGITRIFELSKIASALKAPAKAIDPNIRAMTKEQAKRRMWLGVEYVPVNRDLVKRVDLDRLTKDGTVGFMVSAVYENSPAEAIGIQPGDVLLQIRDLSRDYPTELRVVLAATGAGGYPYGPFPFGDSGGGDAGIWKSRQNFLTEFLAAIGHGKPIEVTFCSRRAPGRWLKITETVDVQQAPLDFDSAKRFRDRQIGLTVRDVTYEVRKALKMSDNQAGIVVSKIEEGTPAAVAKISEGELLTRINGSEIESVDQFENAINAARQAGTQTIKVEILRLGKTRVADLSLSD